jgi:hypothetical protein
VACLLTGGVIALYFVGSQPPSPRVVLARVGMDVLVCLSLLMFIAGLAVLVATSGHPMSWLAAPLALVGVLWMTLTLVGDAMQAGAVLSAGTAIDPTRMGSGAEASQVLYGPIGRAVTALFLLLVAVAVLATGIAPAWVGWSALVVAAGQMALAPTLFGSTDPADFYALNGWSIPVAGGVLLCWVLAAGIAVVKTPTTT